MDFAASTEFVHFKTSEKCDEFALKLTSANIPISVKCCQGKGCGVHMTDRHTIEIVSFLYHEAITSEPDDEATEPVEHALEPSPCVVCSESTSFTTTICKHHLCWRCEDTLDEYACPQCTTPFPLCQARVLGENYRIYFRD
jgi:hypothetical protein